MKIVRHHITTRFTGFLLLSLTLISSPLIGHAQNVTATSSNNPTVQLNQTGNGSTIPPQIWEITGNETIFFVKDVTSNKFPFNIIKGAPSDSFVINFDGTVGLGTLTPIGNGRSLHISGAANQDVFSGIGPDPNNGPAFNFGYSGTSFGPGSGFFNVRGATSGVNPSLRFATADVQRMIVTNTGRVGIGTLSPQQLLEVAGVVRATGFQVGGTNLNVPDYVFEPNYKLLPLKQLAKYIEEEKHLPEIPSAKEVQQNGVNLTEMQMQLLKKIEELTLYALQQEETIAKLTRSLRQVNARVSMLEQRKPGRRRAVEKK
jgi:hypothetical protein